MVWFDTPSNPLLKLIDIKAVSEMAKRKNPNIVVVVDNTFSSGFFQKPLDLGADIVMNSLTKYLNGHSDVIMVIFNFFSIMIFNKNDYYHINPKNN